MKNKALKIVLGVVVALAFAVASLLTYVSTALPDVGPAPDLSIERTAERMERGRYLAHSVCGCIDCHSGRDWDAFSGPILPGTIGKGGEAFDQKLGFPGAYYAQNITPAGIGDWTDGELYRAITSGVSRDGRALFPIMLYPLYGRMSDEDIYSIIAYIRTLEPIENTPPPSSSDFPMNFIINTIPKPAQPQDVPLENDELAYGAYITNAAGCIECHSPKERGQILEGMEYAGGFDFPLPTGGVVRSSNITPDNETGIGKLSRDDFIRLFKQYADSSYRPQTVAAGAYNTMMPWTVYAGMRESDLSAMYAYLMSRKPVRNAVTKFSPPQ